MPKPFDCVPLKDCVHGRLYKLHCRNLLYGVFNEKNNGFIGIREKFGSEYLFTEYHHETGAPFGTVFGVIDTEIDLQIRGGYEVKENMPSACCKTGRPVEFRRDEPDNPKNGKGKWFFTGTDDQIDEDAYSVLYMYQPLFDWLKAKEKELEDAKAE